MSRNFQGFHILFTQLKFISFSFLFCDFNATIVSIERHYACAENIYFPVYIVHVNRLCCHPKSMLYIPSAINLVH